MHKETVSRFRLFFYILAIIITPTWVHAEPGSGIALKVLEKDTLGKGVIYKNLLIGSKELKLSVHVIEADISQGNKPVILKAHQSSSRLQKLHDMISDYDSLTGVPVYGAVNGSFWMYFHNYPMGTTVIDGEVVELNPYREWSTAFFDKKGRMYIDNFKTEASFKLSSGKRFKIHRVNRRHSRNGIALYNSYGGDTIPFITTRKLDRALKTALEDSLYRDITDREFDTTEFVHMLHKMERDSAFDFSLRKISCVYLKNPAVNRDIPLLVKSIDTGLVAMPEDGCIISLGADFNEKYLPKPGDKITLRYSTNILKKKVFVNSVCGAPRLVRNGRSRHEAEKEGVKSKSFIEGELPRTAIGVSKNKKKIFLVSFEGTNRPKGKKGATLVNTAYVMRRIGAYQAMNLDGGGSAIMVINNKNVLWKSRPERSRRLSVGVGIVGKKKNELQSKNR